MAKQWKAHTVEDIARIAKRRGYYLYSDNIPSSVKSVIGENLQVAFRLNILNKVPIIQVAGKKYRFIHESKRSTFSQPKRAKVPTREAIMLELSKGDITVTRGRLSQALVQKQRASILDRLVREGRANRQYIGEKKLRFTLTEPRSIEETTESLRHVYRSCRKALSDDLLFSKMNAALNVSGYRQAGKDVLEKLLRGEVKPEDMLSELAIKPSPCLKE